MEALGLIPARGGSKSIPGKNISPLAGQPLLAYTCEAARSSHLLSRTILSTDDAEIARVGKEYGVEVPFLRPEELSRDVTPALPVIQHALHWLMESESYHPDVVVLLQPTSPLRRAEHIDSALKLLFGSEADTVVSVVQIPHQYHPLSAMKLEGGLLKPFLEGEGTRVQRRQEKPPVYARNGPAILAMRGEVIESGRLYGDRIIPYIMEWSDSIDIDTPLDLLIAETLLRKINANS